MREVMIKKIPILRVVNEEISEVEDVVVSEYYMTIVLKCRNEKHTLCFLVLWGG